MARCLNVLLTPLGVIACVSLVSTVTLHAQDGCPGRVFQGTPETIAIWDNRCTQHKPVNDFFPQHRRLHRVTVAGDRPH